MDTLYSWNTELDISFVNILSAIICILVTFIISIYLHASGVFYKVQIKTGAPIFGTLFIAYKFHKGPYSSIYKAFKEINSIKKNSNKDLLGIYYDDPKMVFTK